MALSRADHERVVEALGREPTATEAAMFENLWSEHCAYRSSRPLLAAFETEGEHVVVGPGDDAGVVALDDETLLVLGIESHNHPSYVDPYDGAATGIGGIVRDVMSMGAYPIALVDALFFGPFDREHSRYLFEGVVDGIADYGNAIGVPTVGGSVSFHGGYRGNPLVNVGCVGITTANRLVRGAAQTAGDAIVIVGNATGRDGLGGASFASEDLEEDAVVADRPAVQVGDPYAEKLLIEANEELLDRELVVAARDLGAAGLGGATSELVAQGGLGAAIDLERLHQREPGMNATELLLAESQERMAYEVDPDDVEDVLAVAERYDLGASVVGEVTEGNYVCRFEGEVVVDVPAELVADGAPVEERAGVVEGEPTVDRPAVELAEAAEDVLTSPNTVSREWVYRQYDHEVGLRTGVRPGDDAAVLAIREADCGLALAAGAVPAWTQAEPRRGGAAVGLEQAANLAVKGAEPIVAVDCLNGGNPEKPAVFGGVRAAVFGLAEMLADLAVPVVGGNVSLYNDSEHGPVPPTPTTFMLGRTPDLEVPPLPAVSDAEVCLVGDPVAAGAPGRLGGSELFARRRADGRFPELPDDPAEVVDALVTAARHEATLATHDVAQGGLVTALAEMVTPDAGLDVEVGPSGDPLEVGFHERPGRAVVVTTEPEGLVEAVGDATTVERIGRTTVDGEMSARLGGERLDLDAATIAEWRDLLPRSLD
ncbi:MAG: phosphoribosylformylglycinamidine synthase subunit PurL [Halobacteriales archaeon]